MLPDSRLVIVQLPLSVPRLSNKGFIPELAGVLIPAEVEVWHTAELVIRGWNLP